MNQEQLRALIGIIDAHLAYYIHVISSAEKIKSKAVTTQHVDLSTASMGVIVATNHLVDVLENYKDIAIMKLTDEPLVRVPINKSKLKLIKGGK